MCVCVGMGKRRGLLSTGLIIFDHFIGPHLFILCLAGLGVIVLRLFTTALYEEIISEDEYCKISHCRVTDIEN